MGETKLRNIYNNAKASNNLLSICDINAKDLEIVDTDKFTYLLTPSPARTYLRQGKVPEWKKEAAQDRECCGR